MITDAPRCAHCDLVYRERAQLLAYIATGHPSVIAYNDPEWPEFPVLYVSTTEGQVSWHLSARDLDLFPHVPVVAPDHADAQWDGHTTEEKYARVARLARGNGENGPTT